MPSIVISQQNLANFFFFFFYDLRKPKLIGELLVGPILAVTFPSYCWLSTHISFNHEEDLSKLAGPNPMPLRWPTTCQRSQIRKRRLEISSLGLRIRSPCSQPRSSSLTSLGIRKKKKKKKKSLPDFTVITVKGILEKKKNQK
jgi:hypothetical protein